MRARKYGPGSWADAATFPWSCKEKRLMSDRASSDLGSKLRSHGKDQGGDNPYSRHLPAKRKQNRRGSQRVRATPVIPGFGCLLGALATRRYQRRLRGDGL